MVTSTSGISAARTSREHGLVGLRQPHADDESPLARGTGCRRAASSSGPAPSFCRGTSNGGRSASTLVSCTACPGRGEPTTDGQRGDVDVVHARRLPGAMVDVDPHLSELRSAIDTGSLVTVRAGAAFTSTRGDREHERGDDDLDEQRPPEPAHVAVEVGDLVHVVVVIVGKRPAVTDRRRRVGLPFPRRPRPARRARGRRSPDRRRRRRSGTGG